MLRSELKPGDLFRYVTFDQTTLYWVPEAGKLAPSVALASFAGVNTLKEEVTLVSRAGHTSQPETAEIDPTHYKALDPEPVDVMDAWDLSRWLAQVVKYVARAGKKPNNDAVTDLKKAHRYLSREIARLEGRRAWT